MEIVAKPAKTCPLLKEPCLGDQCAWWLEIKAKVLDDDTMYLTRAPSNAECAMWSLAGTALLTMAGFDRRQGADE